MRIRYREPLIRCFGQRVIFAVFGVAVSRNCKKRIHGINTPDSLAFTVKKYANEVSERCIVMRTYLILDC